MARRRWIKAGLVAGAVGLGAVLGAVAFAPGLGIAQTETGSDTEQSVDAGWCIGFGEGPFAVAAEAIGIPHGDLLYAIREGSTIAEVAESEDVDTQVVIDALVASMQERLDTAVEDGFLSQELADELSAALEDRATSIVNGDYPAFPGFHHGPFGGPFSPGVGSSDEDASNVGLF
jgi:hypothetical protein